MNPGMSSDVYLSVLIPVYNQDVSRLLEELHRQALELSGGTGVEILVLEDGSTEKYTNRNTADRLSTVRYEESAENRGRAATRNTLIEQAGGACLLFLDADMLPDRDDFLDRYIQHARAGGEILCGGISYTRHIPSGREYGFYLYKSRHTEALPAAVRNKAPWRYLFTSNIMVRRDIVRSVRFNRNFTGYGFEDIEWGIRLARLYTVEHIDNSCSHTGVMDKKQVFGKMRESITNFALLVHLHPEKTVHFGAVRVAGLLQLLPGFLLRGLDTLLSVLFDRIAWNPLLLPVFQLDKAVLLALELKKNND
jgi:glycosyltransferase involved in cell wall biosynthesis